MELMATKTLSWAKKKDNLFNQTLSRVAQNAHIKKNVWLRVQILKI